MNVLIACEFSATVRDAFRAKGHNAWSCDLLPTEGNPGFHHQGDIRDFIYAKKWDLMIAHPPCTYLSVSGLHWNKKRPEREAQTVEALGFIKFLWSHKNIIPRICIENPVGCINSRLAFMPKPQYIQPYDFGEDASKKTGLWLRNLPPLVPTKRIHGRFVCCGLVKVITEECVICKGDKVQAQRWSNQTNSGQNKLAPSADRWKLRSMTYQGIANAMADQWGIL